jgi:hypothetical protein
MRVDVTQSTDVQAMVTKAVSKCGGWPAFNDSSLVRSAAGVVETSEDDWNPAVATHLTGFGFA